MQFDERERVYGRDEYYWGTDPNDLAVRTVAYVRESWDEAAESTDKAAESTDKAAESTPNPDDAVESSPRSKSTRSPRIVDVGAGEGRDAVFFAEQGFDVLATDVSPNGLAKAARLADARAVDVETTVADANDMRLADAVDAVYSVGAVQYVEPVNRERQFAHFKDRTTSGGVHVVFAFVDHPDVPTPPDWTANEYFYDPGELAEYYADWRVLETESLVFPDDSGDEPHEHAAEIVIARKPGGYSQTG